jgi:pimeloyl-ACP methyl ester carboxylesterase
MKTQKIDTPNGAVAFHESSGGEATVVVVHGNSSSARAFLRQIAGPVGERFRLVAIDLPGHGESDDALDGVYSLKGHARAVRSVVDALALHDAYFLGWSLGGHVALEMAPDLPNARGFAIFGAPPLAFPPAMEEAFLPNPALRLGFQESLGREQVAAYVASFFRPGFADIPPFFLEDALRTDGRARSGVGASIAPGGDRDEVAIVRQLKAPLAVLHGAEEQLVSGGYFASLAMPTLWRGAVQTIADAGHAPQWERPEAFDALIAAFVGETN